MLKAFLRFCRILIIRKEMCVDLFLHTVHVEKVLLTSRGKKRCKQINKGCRKGIYIINYKKIQAS